MLMGYNTSPSSSAFNIPPPPFPRSAVEISYDSSTTLTTRIMRAASTETLNKPRWCLAGQTRPRQRQRALHDSDDVSKNTNSKKNSSHVRGGGCSQLVLTRKQAFSRPENESLTWTRNKTKQFNVPLMRKQSNECANIGQSGGWDEKLPSQHLCQGAKKLVGRKTRLAASSYTSTKTCLVRKKQRLHLVFPALRFRKHLQQAFKVK